MDNSEQQPGKDPSVAVHPAAPSVSVEPVADEEVPLDVLPNDDERMYPDLVDNAAQFEQTGAEEEEENTNMGVDGDDKDAADVPVIASEKFRGDIVDPGFIMHPPIQGRSAGRPRKVRIRSSVEGAGLGLRKRKCRRCGRLGHIARNCKHAVDPAFGESLIDGDAETSEQSGPKAKKGKGKSVEKMEKSIGDKGASKTKKGKGKTDGEMDKTIGEKSAPKAKKGKEKSDGKMGKTIGENSAQEGKKGKGKTVGEKEKSIGK